MGLEQEKCNKPLERNRDYIENQTPFWAFDLGSKTCKKHFNIVEPNKFRSKADCEKTCMNRQ